MLSVLDNVQITLLLFYMALFRWLWGRGGRAGGFYWHDVKISRRAGPHEGIGRKSVDFKGPYEQRKKLGMQNSVEES